MTSDEIRAMIREAAAGNVAAWAKNHGLSASYVTDVLGGRREPGPGILGALGLERQISYQPRAQS